MALVKSIFLIDGENLVIRYQEMIKKGRIPLKEVVHIPDVFVWHQNIAPFYRVDIFRVIYYTSAIGDDKYLRTIEERISENKFIHSGNYYGICQLVPFVFKKLVKSHKSRLVDIHIAVDSLKYSNMVNIECISILSGDGDFKKVYSETMSSGKKVIVGAFSDGLDTSIKNMVDIFFLLDEVFFEKEIQIDENNKQLSE